MTDIIEAVKSGQFIELAGISERRFGVRPDPDQLRTQITSKILLMYGRGLNPEEIGFGPSGKPWSEAYKEHWLKTQLIECGAFGDGGMQYGPTEGVSSCILHVGFLSILETDQELARLRGHSEEVKRDQVARSKLVRYMANHHPHPIDRVAGRVAPEG